MFSNVNSVDWKLRIENIQTRFRFKFVFLVLVYLEIETNNIWVSKLDNFAP